MIESLKNNQEAQETDLYIFSDGPKDDSYRQQVCDVRNYIYSISGFKSVTQLCSEINKGLAPSIIEGVTKVFDLNTTEKVIVLEDDLILSSNFLVWMNSALEQYKDNYQVFSISGFCPSVIRKGDVYFYDGFFTKKAHSWGWATWKDRWQKVDWNVSDWDEFSKRKSLQRNFNSIGSEMSDLLFDQMNGIKSSWWVRFCYTQFKLGKYTLYPIFSKVINDGFTTEATHCNGYNRYKVDFDLTQKDIFNFPNNVEEDAKLSKRFFMYFSIKARIIGKMETFLMNHGLIKQYTMNNYSYNEQDFSNWRSCHDS